MAKEQRGCENCGVYIDAGTRCTDCGAHINTGIFVEFPEYTGLQCLMMPYIQGDVSSVPEEFHGYRGILERLTCRRGEIGYLTIDESEVAPQKAQRGYRAKHGRALHTEAGRLPPTLYGWGAPTGWGTPRPGPNHTGISHIVTLDRDVRVLLANNTDDTCAIWSVEHEDTSPDGDIGHLSDLYPYDRAVKMRAGEVHEIGILTPHESLPVRDATKRQFLRIVSGGVHGREPYFTINPLMS